MASSRSIPQKWRDLRACSLRDWRWLLSAWFGMPFVLRRIHRAGFQAVKADLERPTPNRPGISHDDAVRFARLVRAAANHHFLTLNCLPQSLWIWSHLRAWGQPCELKLGVSGLDADGLRAHAWVELDGLRLNEPDDADLQTVPFQPVGAGSERP